MKWIGRAGRWMLLAVVFALCAALFYLIAVMGDGDDTHDAAAQSAPTLAPAAAMEDGAMPRSPRDAIWRRRAGLLRRARGDALVRLVSDGRRGAAVVTRAARTMRQVRLRLHAATTAPRRSAVSTITPRGLPLHAAG